MSASGSSRLGWYGRPRSLALLAGGPRRLVTRELVAASPAARPGDHRFTAVLPPGSAKLVPAEAKAAVLAAADQLLLGEWEVLGVLRTDLLTPDWFHDPVTGRRAPADRCLR